MTSVRIPVATGVELEVDVRAGDDGVPVLLVHGLASNARLWDGVADHLVAAGHPVAAVDQRGHGRSSKPDTGYDFPTLVADLAAVIAAVGFDRPIVAGQSWGANVVLELAVRRPELVRGVAWVDGGTIELRDRFPTWARCAAALAPPRTEGMALATVEEGLRRRHPDWPEAGIRGVLASFEVRDDGTVAPWLTFDRHVAILRELWAHHPSRRFRDVGIPVLLLPCDDGEVAWTDDKRRSTLRAEAGLPRSRTHWFVADHDVHAQRPAEVVEVLLAALDDGFFLSATAVAP